MAKLTPTPVYYNVQTIVTRTIADGTPTYKCICIPAALTITTPNAVISYQIVDPTPDGIVFTGIVKHNPPPQRQLSDPAISVDGSMLLISDRNSEAGDIDISLQFCDGGEVNFTHDPQIGNVPES